MLIRKRSRRKSTQLWFKYLSPSRPSFYLQVSLDSSCYPRFIFNFFWFRMLWLMVSCLNLALICKIREVHIRFCSILSQYECIVVLVFPKIEPFLMAPGSSTFTNWNPTHLDLDRLQPAFGDERIGTQFHTSTRDPGNYGMASVKSYVILLDLECNALVSDIFHYFLASTAIILLWCLHI